ncbi:hypothetical protein ABFG93_04445 [Pseudalkalibacillus hwajinpoensis]|uniref:hypothetical protein n=1 Tax=Guptibacillus hwajinpoensis TaxID=208199 RepID=UPI00325AB274
MIKVNSSIQKEIIRYQEQLSFFRISLQQLTVSTPSELSTRIWCREVAFTMAQSQSLITKIFKTRKLPYRDLAKQFLCRISSLKRNSKYILALFLLKHGDYHFLNEHLSLSILDNGF